MSDLSRAVYGDDPTLPIHFGDPVAEQLQYEEGNAIHVAGPAGVVTVSGPDRLTWLTTLSSQILTGQEPRASQELLLLDPQGRIEFAAGVVDDPETETTWLLLEPNRAAALVDFLESMKFMTRVEIADRGEEFTAFQTMNAAPVDFPDAIVWQDPWPGVSEGGARYYQGKHPAEGSDVRVYVVPAARQEEFLAAAGLPPAGSLAAEATRIARWRPRLGAEVDERAVPAELDWMRTAVHLTKGCYRGQESVARIVNLGKPPRRITFLHLDGSLGSLPKPGDPLTLNGRQVGVITSAARHAEMGPIALALVKRGADPEADLAAGDIAAAQELIVPVEGKSDHSPSERPGAGLKRLDSGGRDIRTRGPGAGG